MWTVWHSETGLAFPHLLWFFLVIIFIGGVEIQMPLGTLPTLDELSPLTGLLKRSFLCISLMKTTCGEKILLCSQ